jgi:hypothetical protein
LPRRQTLSRVTFDQAEGRQVEADGFKSAGTLPRPLGPIDAAEQYGGGAPGAGRARREVRRPVLARLRPGGLGSTGACECAQPPPGFAPGSRRR